MKTVRVILLVIFVFVSTQAAMAAEPVMRFGTVDISLDMRMDECLKKLESVFEVEDVTDCLGRNFSFKISDSISGAVMGDENDGAVLLIEKFRRYDDFAEAFQGFLSALREASKKTGDKVQIKGEDYDQIKVPDEWLRDHPSSRKALEKRTYNLAMIRTDQRETTGYLGVDLSDQIYISLVLWAPPGKKQEFIVEEHIQSEGLSSRW